MMRSMRTTVNLNEHLLAQAKEMAAASRRTLGDVMDDALRAMFARRQDASAPGWASVSLPTAGGSGLMPGVDLEDKEALAELLGDNRMPDAPR